MLAIGGVGGLAVGLAGREILENLFTGLIILSSSPFEVGDEVLFTPPTGNVSFQPLMHQALPACSKSVFQVLPEFNIGIPLALAEAAVSGVG